ncbi:hssA/2C/7E family protein [Dictyostelium discoideum AX4]|uniref:UPF0512 protein P n=1 Tax=Dictyostelium discoideum TaxID=44689 RepID=U512P_DICDI|nr:hssA/2C/7E family protein [Dictyostelium discoideum AX4]Q54X01.1 RecName: Full=UPF0512 protein P [Dictyostelium discoideum]EAL67795.1 hssA/2C/7E family protein [Dictyostelium discoideum AX4]|eukprot:XP_641776.1 hssA/2C/7E family protein [Dictyostelium discoideum AX4]
MTIFNSISSISNSTRITSSSISTYNYNGSMANVNSTACFDNDFGGWGGLGGFNNGCGGCGGGSNVNVINFDIDIGRRHRRCC